MKRTFPINPLTLVTLVAGSVGFGLRLWAQLATDENRLLEPFHVSLILLYILSALVLVFLFLGARALDPAPLQLRVKVRKLAGAGCMAAALGLAATGVMLLLEKPQGLELVLACLALAGSVCAFFLGLRPDGPAAFWLQGVLCVFFMVHAVGQARVWGTLPQLHSFLFPLLALVFLVLYFYFRCELTARTARCRAYVFFSQAALYYCCVSLPGGDVPLFLGMAIYLACDFSAVQLLKKGE